MWISSLGREGGLPVGTRSGSIMPEVNGGRAEPERRLGAGEGRLEGGRSGGE